MQTFSQLLRKEWESRNLYAAWKARWYELVQILDADNHSLENALNEAFIESILNEKNQADTIAAISPASSAIIDKLQPATRTYITVDWFYKNAVDSFGGEEIEKDGKAYRISSRKGIGGFKLLETTRDSDASNPAEPSIEESKLTDTENEIRENIAKQEASEEEGRKLERDFYPLVRNWAMKNKFERCMITGGKLPLGKWENPDLIDILCEFGLYTMTLNYEVTSFEVKLRTEPSAVWQAAHYKKFSHYVFIAFAQNEASLREAEAVFDLAVSFGLGILALEKQADNTFAFKLIHSPTKNTPSPSETDRFISAWAQFMPDAIRVVNDERINLAKQVFGLVGWTPAAR